eukprot:TRINITY_DN20175_c0_g1_i1.p1 TRINITY_DN20175_c0_g1~~TRINITY_DN20175_c0_g1_i1.p1  ORF type:complete len:362 (+),score=61.30 TRINITY_DN20175_c0_g1_i1:46-1131(+)
MAELLCEFDTAHCGAIHDTQLDAYGQTLATASSDGHVRLWDVRKPEAPAFLADLGGHVGAVYQVAWAPAQCGVLLASVGADGCVLVWGRLADSSSPLGTSWQIVRRECLASHGAIRAVAWAPPEHGVVLSCASADGSVTVLAHCGAASSGPDGDMEHRWQAQNFAAHAQEAFSISWSSPPASSSSTASASGSASSAANLSGARFASAGDDGLRVWSWNDASGVWSPETVNKAPSAPSGVHRATAWKPWDGLADVVASACGAMVLFWRYEDRCWKLDQQVHVGEDITSLTWTAIGQMLMVSYGIQEQRMAMLKQRLDKEWDVMDVEEAVENEPEAASRQDADVAMEVPLFGREVGHPVAVGA